VKAKVVKGQKGTIGLTYSQEDMPFTKDGIIPDIIMNPNAIPKRMTIAQLIECVFGKVGTIAGSELDATPFKKVNVENISEIMEKLGYHGSGTEILYNGKTGEQIEVAIFMGPVFYQRLKHLVEDKQHCFDYETEILTNNGWKKNNEITMDDDVATLKNNELVYELPKAIYDYPANDSIMYHVKNEFIDILVTAEHRMWVSEDGYNYNFVFAKDLVDKNVYYKNNVYYEGFTSSTRYIDSIFINTNYIETDDKILADKIQKESVQAGMVCLIQFIDDIYKCKLFRNNTGKLIINGKTDMKIIENQKIPVWCVEVNSGIILIRRNGKVSFTGNSRSTGPYQLLTHQPAEGRSRDGGFRFGEMERDCMLSHGSIQLLKERTFDCSDKYYVWIDNETGMISPVNPEKGIYKSLYSDNTTRFSKIQIPYASKLLVQELQSLHINPRMMVKK
jgi:hypothetical protein